MRDKVRTMQEMFLRIETSNPNEPMALIALGQIESISFQKGTDHKGDNVVRPVFKMKSGGQYTASALFYGIPGSDFANDLAQYVKESAGKADLSQFCRGRSTKSDVCL